MDKMQATLVENELKRLHTGILETWKIYMTWYTWFFGANLFVLGWLLTKTSKLLEPKNIAILAGSWMLLNLIGLISTLRLRSYTLKVNAQAQELSRFLQESTSFPVSLDSNLGFPSDLGSLAAVANAMSLGINMCLWLYLFIKALIG